jgi:hypothetical protein
MLRVDTLPEEDLHQEVVDLPEDTDDDRTGHCLLLSDVALRFAAAASRSHTGFYESPAVRALTPFRVRAFSTRGSPSA